MTAVRLSCSDFLILPGFIDFTSDEVVSTSVFFTAAQKGLIVGTTVGSQLFQLITAGPKVIQGPIDKTWCVHGARTLDFLTNNRGSSAGRSRLTSFLQTAFIWSLPRCVTVDRDSPSVCLLFLPHVVTHWLLPHPHVFTLVSARPLIPPYQQLTGGVEGIIHCL